MEAENERPQQKVYRARTGTRGLDWRDGGWDEDLVSPLASLAVTVGSCWIWGLGIAMSWQKKVRKGRSVGSSGRGRGCCVLYCPFLSGLHFSSSFSCLWPLNSETSFFAPWFGFQCLCPAPQLANVPKGSEWRSIVAGSKGPALCNVFSFPGILTFLILDSLISQLSTHICFRSILSKRVSLLLDS